MAHQYAVIGAGRQGTAAAYDLARFGDASHIVLADFDLAQARRSADRLNRLSGRAVGEPAALDASDKDAVVRFLRDHHIQAFVSAVPYFFNLGLTHAAIEAGAGMTDLGGNSDVVKAQLALGPQAEGAHVSIVPDCGQVPGMGTSLIVYAMEQLDDTRDVWMWDCGLPQHPRPPWNYSLAFSIEGLTNEYYGDCLYIRDGKTVRVPALEEFELVDFPAPIGQLEAFTTSGGLTTAALTFAGKLRTLQNKTLRYPGGFADIRVIQRLGLLDLDPADVDGQPVIPRHLLHALWEPQIRGDDSTPDLIIIRILARGQKAGEPTEALVDLIHRYDEATGFTAMEQGTGWHAAILTEAIAMGRVRAGAIPVETAMTGKDFVDQAARRGFNVHLELRAASV
jgi:lysine 6-dehydrogenase